MIQTAPRYWQNWDVGNTAKVIDDVWMSSEDEAKSRRRIAEHVLAKFGEEQSLFEVGCGTGLMAKSLIDVRATNEQRYSGGDVSLTMLEIARSRLPKINFTELDIFDLSSVQKRDHVVCFHVIQHLPHYYAPLLQLIQLAVKRLCIVAWFNETDSDEIGMSRDSIAEPSFYTNVYSLPKFLMSLRQLAGNRNARLSTDHLIGNAFAVNAEFASSQ
jgi:trans-aconitate methyltransferase